MAKTKAEEKFDAMGEWCIRFSKIILLIINILFALLGIGLIGVGGYAIEKSDELEQNTELLGALDVSQFGVGILIVGLVVFFLAIIGFVGAWKKIRVLLTMYAIILLCVVVSELVIAIVVIRFNDQVEGQVDKQLKSEWEKDDREDEKRRLQDFLKCCGYETIDDAPFKPCSYNTPCRQAIIDYLQQYVTPIAVSGIIFACLQIAAMVFSCCILCQAKRRDLDEFYFLE